MDATRADTRTGRERTTTVALPLGLGVRSLPPWLVSGGFDLRRLRLSPSARHRLAWLALGLALVVVLSGVLRFDWRDRALPGDQAAYLFQAFSLAGEGHDLSFDAADLDRWREAGFSTQGMGLAFQRNDGGWAFAKPYGYSLYLSPFVAALGPATGVAAGNALLIVLLVGIGAATLWLRPSLRGPGIPLCVTALFLASFAYLYGYVAHSDLFFAVLVAAVFGLLARHWLRDSWPCALAAVIVAAFLVSESARFLPLLVPAFVVVLWRLPTRRRLVLVGAAALAFLVAIAPYLWYSDGQSWNAYSGERMFGAERFPFDHGPPPDARFRPFLTGELFGTTTLAPQIGKLKGSAEATLYYLFGRHTGVVAFMPAALLLVLGTLTAGRWRGGADRRWLAVLAGVAGWVAFHLYAFPWNYYGGGWSLGNRYFLQMAPAVLALVVMARVKARLLVTTGVAGIVLGAIFLAPHHLRPSEAYADLWRTSPAQSLLPFERNQNGANSFCLEYPGGASVSTRWPSERREGPDCQKVLEETERWRRDHPRGEVADPDLEAGSRYGRP